MGFSEIIIIGVMALLLIGPKQLPEMARVLGRLIAEFKKATTDLSGGLLDIKSELQKPMRENLEELQKLKNEILAKVEEETRNIQKATQEMADDKTAEIQHPPLDHDDLHHEQAHHHDPHHVEHGTVAAQDSNGRKRE